MDAVKEKPPPYYSVQVEITPTWMTEGHKFTTEEISEALGRVFRELYHFERQHKVYTVRIEVLGFSALVCHFALRRNFKQAELESIQEKVGRLIENLNALLPKPAP